MKRLLFVFVILFILLVLMSLKLLKKDGFKISADNVIKSIQNNSNLISESQVNKDFLIVFLDEELPSIKNSGAEIVKIPFQDLLEKNYQESLKNTKLKIGLFSNDASKLAKTYTLLNQMGFKNLYIIQKEGSENETLLYKFRPDTISQE
ncbi:MAG: hypothetical protein JXR31_11780 [Prolixibacteraceae bacterium]|nr:hypothetical protein [Prolixibacteraceae bacterium]MBN2774924.1 hypothetical protein [Prolixibacteraceae bacterium]